MSINRSHNTLGPQIKGRTSGKLTGPIGPIPIGTNPDELKFMHIFSFSEVIVCDWHSHDENWVRKDLVIAKSSGYCFRPGAIKYIHMSAWPCSMSNHTEEDSGWAIDGWEAIPITNSEGDYIQVTLKVAITGIGTRFNRFGYTWTAYVTEI